MTISLSADRGSGVINNVGLFSILCMCVFMLPWPYTYLASPSPLPSASLARQWSLSYWNTALRPSLRREGIMLCFSMSQYMLAFMVPSMNCSSPVPAALMQPQTMTPPPPCLTVGKSHLSLYSSPDCRYTHLTPSEPIRLLVAVVALMDRASDL